MEHFSDRDMVLECLLVEGTFDHVDPNTLDMQEELAMNHASCCGISFLDTSLFYYRTMLSLSPFLDNILTLDNKNFHLFKY